MKIGEACRREVVTVSRDSTVLEAAKRMRAGHVGDVVVTEANGDNERPVGILTDRDIVVELVAKEVDLDAVTVSDVMSPSLTTASSTAELFETIELMAAERVRRLPVLDAHGRLFGVLSMDDVVRLLAEQLQRASGIVPAQLARESFVRE
jgi:CBS domain-containing protein